MIKKYAIELERVNGVKISCKPEDGVRHHYPHVHVQKNGTDVPVSIEEIAGMDRILISEHKRKPNKFEVDIAKVAIKWLENPINKQKALNAWNALQK